MSSLFLSGNTVKLASTDLAGWNSNLEYREQLVTSSTIVVTTGGSRSLGDGVYVNLNL